MYSIPGTIYQCHTGICWYIVEFPEGTKHSQTSAQRYKAVQSSVQGSKTVPNSPEVYSQRGQSGEYNFREPRYGRVYGQNQELLMFQSHWATFTEAHSKSTKEEACACKYALKWRFEASVDYDDGVKGTAVESWYCQWNDLFWVVLYW